MEFTKQDILQAITERAKLTTDKAKAIEVIKGYVLDGTLTEEDVRPVVNILYPPELDEDGNIVGEFELFSLDEVKLFKIQQISQQIGELINSGVEYNGKQYSCKLEDQFTVKALLDEMAETDTVYYNANGGSCDPFTYQELEGLKLAMLGHVKYYKTLNGEIKIYIQSMGVKDDVLAFTLDSIPQSVIDSTIAKMG